VKRSLSVLAWLIAICSLARAEGVSVRPVRDLERSFIMGADVSMLGQLESSGAVFRDEKGKASDCLSILKSGGVNWIRLRIWNDPVNREDVVEDGRLLSRAGDPAGGGNDDLAAYIRIATRAKKLGLKVLADFHYSDFWADPGKQATPYAWKDLDLGGLEKAVYDYTSSCLGAMRAAGVAPDMVQVGNEIDDGFLWPLGKITPGSSGGSIGGEEGFVALVKEAIRAVRDGDPAKRDPARRIRVMIHASNGGSKANYRKVFDPLVQRGVDFDVIGLSFYPYWHGKVADLAANLADLATRYGKDLIVAETAYAWTFEKGSSIENSFGPGADRLGGYRATVQGQASAIADIIAAVAGAPGGKGRGVFYWEPDWIPLPGAGWRTGDGESWGNQALFDYEGRALPSLRVFKLVAAKRGLPDLSIVAVEDFKAKVAAGSLLELPATIQATYSDDSYRPVQVRWDMPEASALKEVGKLVVRGSVQGYKGEVRAEVDIVANANLIPDSSFESGRLAPEWALSGEGAAAAMVEKNPGNAHSGDWSFKFWLDKPFRFTLERRFAGLKDGSYAFRVWAAGGGGEKSYALFARNYGGPDLGTDIVDTGWQKWKLYEIKGIAVVGGSCELGLAIEGNAGNWGNVDDVEFVREGD
jgi:arabinogalactan endo-1,4-beta-galactosidase